MSFLIIEDTRSGYSPDQVRNPITVGELKFMLDEFDDNDVIITSHDHGYTYGSLSRDYDIVENESDEDGSDAG